MDERRKILRIERSLSMNLRIWSWFVDCLRDDKVRYRIYKEKEGNGMRHLRRLFGHSFWCRRPTRRNKSGVENIYRNLLYHWIKCLFRKRVIVRKSAHTTVCRLQDNSFEDSTVCPHSELGVFCRKSFSITKGIHELEGYAIQIDKNTFDTLESLGYPMFYMDL